ncbi:MAG: LemA family protein [Fimbriimonadia bacterium]|jgi:LemA protein
MVWVLVILILAVLVVAGWLIGSYNRLVTQRNRCHNSMAQIDVQLKRRHDLIPNLVETVKGYAAHEKEAFEKVSEYRAKAMSASTVSEKSQTENMLTQALRSVFAVAEAYPELKANQNFLQLQDELSDTESKIGYARQIYNDSVMLYENARQTFPTVLLAQMFGFGKEEYFELDATPEQREAPQVRF